uniref:Uncharacterized protein n=1 Tax=Tetradesmus obliquus TaxID=3088 RepID=A0A383VAU0_TETOB|eukprot:jgi/Sobl393_1/15487/SZX61734.1
MPKKRKEPAQPPPSTATSVEVQRLQALVKTQRLHIDELNHQLQETLEIKKQQQLQLLDRSPAPRNVRQLLARAAADNTALARKVEELRAQRNALAVTKAALTAQLSELIRGAADGAQNNTQHKVLLQQLHQLCSYIGLHRLQDPAQQMAAVLQYVQEARQERQQLHGERSQVQDPSAATTEASLLLSPTGRQLDQTATSQLVWDTSQCVELFPPGHPQGAAAANATPGSAASTVVELGSAWSRCTDLSYLSPLRSSGAAKQQRSPNSSTPVPLQAAGYADDDDDDDSPLSQQSLSMFSASNADAASPGSVNPRRLQLTTPASKLGQGCDAATGMTTHGSCSGSCTPASSLSFTFADTAAKQRDQQQGRAPAAAGSPQLVAMMSPVFGIGPQQQQQHGLWSSPALTGISMAALHGRRPAAACNSHMLWLPEGAGGGASPAPARELALDFSPIVGRHAGSSSGRSGVWGEDDGPRCFSFEPADEADEEEEQQQWQVKPSRRRWWLAVGLCTVVPLTLVAAAGGAAWRFKSDEVQELAAALKLGARVAAQQTRSAASAGWRQCQLSASAVRARAQRLMQRGSASTHAGSGGYDGSDVHVAAAVPQS